MSTLTYEHFVYIADEGSANALAGVYQEAGYIVEVRPSAADDRSWLVMVYEGYDLGADEPSTWRHVMRIAEAHGAEYDGGGCYVGPLRQLGPT